MSTHARDATEESDLLHAKGCSDVLREGVAKGVLDYYSNRTASHLAALIGRSVSTVTRERGPDVSRYNGLETLAFVVDDLGGDCRLLGHLVALARRGSAQDRASWVERDLAAAVKEMMHTAVVGVDALAIDGVSQQERKDLAKALSPLIGLLSVLLFNLQGGDR